MAIVTTSLVAAGLKKTLEEIITDGKGPSMSTEIWRKYMVEKTMSDNYEDDVEYAGPGLAMEVGEGGDIPVGSIKQGIQTRYVSKKFGLLMIVSDEAEEDLKYDKIVDSAVRLTRVMSKTVDIDAALMLVRGFDTNYTYGDGQPLFSASHPLIGGGTDSNLMAVPTTPSVASLSIATSQLRLLKGHDGITDGVNPVTAVFPTSQWAQWSQLTKSKFVPEAGNFSTINVVNEDLGLKLVSHPYWSNTTTNWALITDADKASQPNLRWRRKPRSRSWVNQENEVTKFSVTARWARGASDYRGIYGVNA